MHSNSRIKDGKEELGWGLFSGGYSLCDVALNSWKFCEIVVKMLKFRKGEIRRQTERKGNLIQKKSHSHLKTKVRNTVFKILLLPQVILFHATTCQQHLGNDVVSHCISWFLLLLLYVVAFTECSLGLYLCYLCLICVVDDSVLILQEWWEPPCLPSGLSRECSDCVVTCSPFGKRPLMVGWVPTHAGHL